MKYTVETTSTFRREYRRAQKRGKNMQLLKDIVAALAMGQSLPPKNRDHDLTGDMAGYRACHIQPDWLLLYRIEEEILILTLVHTGSHSDLFG